ncbi:MAG: GatB/YqeY domain-containing protein [Patescibacteria group bacterium]|jgi:hypothetical protein
MSLYNQINDDLKKAMKAQDAFLLGTLRMVYSSMKYKAIDKKADLTDDDCQKILASEAKKRKDSIAAFEKGNRPELAEKEKKELEIIKKYLPKQLSEEELRAIIVKVVAANAGLGFGPMMGKVMAQAKGKADGALVQKILKEETDK